MKMSRKFITVCVAGVMALGIAVSAWAAEPKVTDQKIRSGGVAVNIPVVKGAVGGAEVDDKVNMAIDFNIVKKLYAYLPGGSGELSLQGNYYPEFDGYGGAKASREGAEYSVPLPQYEEGASLTSIWAVRSLGIDPTTGKEIFLNRDGSIADKWNAAQEVVVGNTEPKCSGAFGLNLSYKNWTLFASFLYEWGGQEYNQTLVNNVENADLVNKNVDLRVLTDRWKKPGDIA